MMIQKGMRLLVASLFFALCSCSTISPFSEQAYNNVINTKVDAWALMDKATDSYVSHQKDVDTFNIELRKAYEFDKNRPLNITTVKQWDILMSPNEHLLGGFLADWKKKNKITSKVYIGFKQKQIGRAFDEIAQLEAGKERK